VAVCNFKGIPPVLAAIRQHLWQYKCAVKLCDQVPYSAKAISFHPLEYSALKILFINLCVWERNLFRQDTT
jgi:hypothetical protein